MCLILFAYQSHPHYRLVLAANRDEFYARPTDPMQFWKDEPDILAGRDCKHGGTWMGITRAGRLAAITNYRDPASVKEDAPSRGALVADYLKGHQLPGRYLSDVAENGHRYNGFNLMVGDHEEIFYYSNQGDGIRAMGPGIYGISNRLLDTPWPKVIKGKAELAKIVEKQTAVEADRLFQLMADRSLPPDRDLPDTGVGLEKERMLSPLFIASDDYGTRCTSIVLWDNSNTIEIWERTYFLGNTVPTPKQTRHFRFSIPSVD